MADSLRLLCVLAHPDDESLGAGGTLVKYAREGVETYVLTATRGERGWFDAERPHPGLAELGRTREAELRAAAQVLGVHGLALLDYVDGDLDQADPAAAVAQIAGHLRRVRPQVVVTFGPEGAYGHPDHIAISQLTTAAIVAAADAGYAHGGPEPAHRVTKFYYALATGEELDVYQTVFGDLVMHIDGVERRAAAWPGWALTTRIDTARYWRTVWEAVACHRTQLPNYERLANLSPEQHQALWGSRGFYRVFSLVNGGRTQEDDLFAGLR